MKKIMYLGLLTAVLLSENRVWLSIMDLSLDNNGEVVANSEIKEIESVNVKSRIGDLIDYIEKKFNE